MFAPAMNAGAAAHIGASQGDVNANAQSAAPFHDQRLRACVVECTEAAGDLDVYKLIDTAGVTGRIRCPRLKASHRSNIKTLSPSDVLERASSQAHRVLLVEE